MINLLVRLFVKDRNNVKNPNVRRSYGTLVSIVGIVLNALLSIFKFIAGSLIGSVAIRADAVNNLSDAGSSIVSLVSFKLSAKPADRDHPFGHARIEYVASMIVSFLILHIGLDLVKSSVQKLFSPVTPTFHIVTIIILGVSDLLKLWLSLFNRKLGKTIDSDVMRATAADSLSDAIATSAVLIATIVSPMLPTQIAPYIDPIMGLMVAILIFVAGGRVLHETKNSILGEAPSAEIVETIEKVVEEYPDAIGIHDLVVHNYGPGRTLASLHVEVDGHRDIFASHDTIDLIERRLRTEYGIECSIHLDPVVVGDALTDEWHARVAAHATAIDARIRVHDFRMVPGTTHTNLIFDMEVPFEVTQSDAALKACMAERIASEAPDYFTVITIDRD